MDKLGSTIDALVLEAANREQEEEDATPLLASLLRLRFGPLRHLPLPSRYTTTSGAGAGAGARSTTSTEYLGSSHMLADRIDEVWIGGLFHTEHVVGYPSAVNVNACLLRL